ncbi:uncharacterized protein LOC116934939 isoform X2 [Daphnia magna]|uniref:uncharacterized protein LOC116934939 isoform X2 n=1 Tax=Daphnia magna TaxID=35525 RepID=UPI001E1BD2D7|nr:uncharacterized protein LOC116934939 isoform X2 [Daphnia magna]
MDYLGYIQQVFLLTCSSVYEAVSHGGCSMIKKSWIFSEVGRFLKRLFCSLENLRLAAIVACLFLFWYRFNVLTVDDTEISFQILAVIAPSSIYQAVPRKLFSDISVSFARGGMPVTVRFLPGPIEHCCGGPVERVSGPV